MQKFTISRDDTIYEAFPDVALTPSGKLVCTFAECTHHGDRSYTRIMLTDSTDRLCELPSDPLAPGVPLPRRRLRLSRAAALASDDRGATWRGPVIVGKQAELNLCEVSLL